MSVTGFVAVIIGVWLALPATVARGWKDEAEKVAVKPEKLAKDAEFALASLYEKAPATKILAENAQGYSRVPKNHESECWSRRPTGHRHAIEGGQAGEGFYTTTGTSVGLQAGAKTYGYALFFMNDNAVQALSKAKGFEAGVGPTVVVVNKGMSKNLTTTTLKG